MSDQPEVLLSSRIFDVVRMKQKCDDGKEHIRDIIMHPGAVVILPITTEGHVVLIENYRVAAGQWLVELPAGTREKDEAPERTARRELIEETGYRAEEMRLLTSFYASPGCMREEMFLYEATGLTEGQMKLEPGEQIKPIVRTLDEALAMVWDGRIRDAKTIIGLLWRSIRGDR